MGWRQAKESASQCARVCRNRPLANHHLVSPRMSFYIHVPHDWTTEVRDNGNEWRKFRDAPRSRPLRPLILALSNRSGNRRACRLHGTTVGFSTLFSTYLEVISVAISLLRCQIVAI